MHHFHNAAHFNLFGGLVGFVLWIAFWYFLVVILSGLFYGPRNYSRYDYRAQCRARDNAAACARTAAAAPVDVTK